MVSHPIEGLTLGAVLGRWGNGLTYHGTWEGRPVAVTVSRQHGWEQLLGYRDSPKHYPSTNMLAGRRPALRPCPCVLFP